MSATRDIHETPDAELIAASAVSEDTARERSHTALQPFRWKPGQSGNPGGRLGSFARRVRAATADGADLIAFLTAIVGNPSERTRDRLHAAELLLNRGWGRALQTVALKALLEDRSTNPRMQALAKLSMPELERLEALLMKVEAAEPLPAPEQVR